MEAVISHAETHEAVYVRPAIVADDSKEAFYSTNVTINGSTQNITSKNQAESIHQALELFLGAPPSYENFVKKFCFPSFSQETKQSKYQLRKLEELYFFERYFAANCKAFFGALRPIPDTNLWGEIRSKGCKEECDVFAYRICKALIFNGLYAEKLRVTYKDNIQHMLSAEILLPRNIVEKMGEDKTEVVVRFCNEKLQNFFVQM